MRVFEHCYQVLSVVGKGKIVAGGVARDSRCRFAETDPSA
jgi:hypothetical protein